METLKHPMAHAQTRLAIHPMNIFEIKLIELKQN